MKQLGPGDDCGFTGVFSVDTKGKPAVQIDGLKIGRFLYDSLKNDDIDIDHLNENNVVVRIHITVVSVGGVTVPRAIEQPIQLTWFEKNYGWLYEDQSTDKETV